MPRPCRARSSAICRQKVSHSASIRSAPIAWKKRLLAGETPPYRAMSRSISSPTVAAKRTHGPASGQAARQVPGARPDEAQVHAAPQRDHRVCLPADPPPETVPQLHEAALQQFQIRRAGPAAAGVAQGLPPVHRRKGNRRDAHMAQPRMSDRLSRILAATSGVFMV